MRKEATESEKILWKYLRREQLGARFLRQYGIGFYIVDFYCPFKKLIIEIDGGYHKQKEVREYDEERTQIMEGLGLSLCRFTNEQVLSDIDGVCDEIKSFLN